MPIDFATVRGSGHMVPEYKPATTLAFISAFVKGEAYKRYTPPPSRLSQRRGAALFPDVVHSEL